MGKIIIVAESGADIPREFIRDNEIFTVPMHVTMGEKNLNDGDFPMIEVFEFYRKEKTIPKTSAPAPKEYREVFEDVHRKYPNSRILHLCYSAATSATMQNAVIGSDGLDFVEHMDTKCCSAGQGMVVLRAANYIRNHPDAGMEDVKDQFQDWIRRSRMVFVPGNMEFLRAGGRVSNAAYMGATLLHIKPLIEIVDGRLICEKKYRGSMLRVIEKALEEKMEEYQWEDKQFFFVYSEGLDEQVKRAAEEIVAKQGIHQPIWIKTGATVSVHCGPGAFGFGGMVAENS